MNTTLEPPTRSEADTLPERLSNLERFVNKLIEMLTRERMTQNEITPWVYQLRAEVRDTKAAWEAAQTPRVRILPNAFGGYGMCAANDPAHALFSTRWGGPVGVGPDVCGNFACPADARRRARQNGWEVVE